MTLSDHLYSNPETAMPFGVAQVELMELMKSGGVLCYVDHDPCYLTGYVFNGFTYHDDYVGLSPRPDDRYWGYVVVDAATTRKAWADRKAARHAVAKTLPASEGAVFTKLTAREVNDWYQERVKIATSNGFRWSRDEDERAGKRRGVLGLTIRELGESMVLLALPPSGPPLGRSLGGRGGRIRSARAGRSTRSTSSPKTA